MKHFIAFLVGLFLVTPAAAQIKQSGSVTNNHVPYWVTSGVLGDGGTSLDSPITSIGVTSAGGAGICTNSARANSGAWQSFCLGFIGGIPTLASQNHGSAPAQNLQFSINGTVISVPTGGQSFVFSNGPYTTGDVPCFFNSSGVLQDCGLALSSGTITAGVWNGTAVAVGFGGTGATTATTARTNLGLGTMATQNAGAVAVTGGTITGMPNPAVASDVANKAYVDATASGLTILPASTLATAAVLPNTPTYNNGAATLTAGSNTTLTVDGTAAPLNTVVLVKNQASSFQNGIYSVTTAGGGVPWVLTRVSYFNSSVNMTKGSFTFVSSGATNINTGWVLSASVVTVGTDPVTFNQFSNSSPGVVSLGGQSGILTCGTGMVCSGSNVAANGAVVANVKTDYGAVGDCATDDTTAFQNAINAAAAAGGQGVVYVPPVASGKCYLVSAINATGLSNFTIQGNGDKSLIEPHGTSAVNHNWFDLSIASNVSLRDLKIGYDGATVPSVLFMSGMTAGARPTGIRFYRVNIASHTTQALFYGFGNAANNNQNVGMSCEDSTWVQLHNGSAQVNPYLRNTTIDLDGSNSKSLGSDYVTFTSGAQGTLAIALNNCMFTDFPAGFGSGSRDNNAGGIVNLVGNLIMNGGGFRCVCFADLILWGTAGGSVENAVFNVVDFENADGSSNTVEQLVDSGGATQGNITFNQPFWSEPLQTMLALDAACGSSCGGIARLKILSPDINNLNSATLIGDINCAGFTSTNAWISQSYIDAEGYTIQSCGVIDNHTLIITPGAFSSAGAINAHLF